jgi:VWFA-related protein
MGTRLFVAAVLVVVASLSLLSQSPRTFTSSTELVRVYATVRDNSGHLVTDLQEKDFQIRDRGSTVPLAFFSKEVQPIRVAIMVDMSGTVFETATYQQLRDGLAAFVSQFTPSDRAIVGWFSHEQIVLGSTLTEDVNELKRRIDGEVRFERAHPRLAGGNAHFGVHFRGRPLWNAISAATDALAGEQGRKVVLILANGDNTTVLPGFPRLKELRTRLASDEFMVYAVTGYEPRKSDFSPRQADHIMGSAEERQTTLRQITHSTGGGFLVAPFDAVKGKGGGWVGVDVRRNGLSLAFRSQLAGIVDELRNQYTLGFVPTKRDGKAGSIEVRVNRPEADVWARKTYIAPHR